MKLNLGCANKQFPGWINVDCHDYESYRPSEGEFWQADLRAVLSSLHDNVAEAISMIHVLDHFDPYDAQSILINCLRVLAPEGVLRLEVEDAEAILKAWRKSELNRWNNDQPTRYGEVGEDLKLGFLIFGNLSGKSEYTGHKMIYTQQSLREMLHYAGFERMVVKQSGVSAISGWRAEWDTQPEHSLFMEAYK